MTDPLREALVDALSVGMDRKWWALDIDHSDLPYIAEEILAHPAVLAALAATPTASSTATYLGPEVRMLGIQEAPRFGVRDATFVQCDATFVLDTDQCERRTGHKGPHVGEGTGYEFDGDSVRAASPTATGERE